MKVLVTGGAGFIGSHIVDRLIDKDYQVIIADNLSSGNRDNVNPAAKFHLIDIKTPEIERIFQENKIDYVIHEAAQTSVDASMKNPCNDLRENALGSANLFNMCKKYNVKKVIAASTAAVYGLPEYIPVDETHKTEALSFYGLSKITMEKYLKMFGIDYIIFRYSNVYGPRQDAFGEAGVVSIFIDKLLSDNPVEIHGDGNQTRDFIYVNDIAEANVMALESDICSETINLSSNTKTSINQLFDILLRLANSAVTPSYTSEREGDIRESMLDNARAKTLLGWTVLTDFEYGLKNTVEWQKEILKKKARSSNFCSFVYN